MAQLTTNVQTPAGKRHDVRWLDEYGKRKFRRFVKLGEARSFHTQVAAAEQRRQQLRRDGVDLNPHDETATVWTWVSGYLDRRTLSARYERQLRWVVDAHLQGTRLASLPLSAVRLGDIKDAMATVTSGHNRNRLTGVLRRAFDDAVDRELIGSNPFRAPSARAPMPKRVRKIRPLEQPEIDALFAALDQPWKLMCELALYAATRPGELIALQARDLHARTGNERLFLRIERAVDDDGTFKGLKTANDGVEERDLPLTDALADALLLHCADNGLAGENLLFSNRLGAPLDLDDWRARIWMPARIRAGVRHAVPYDLRHTCASRLIASGADVVSVAKWLGHTKPSTTLDHYGHFFTEGLDAIADRQDPGGARLVALDPAAATAVRSVSQPADVRSPGATDTHRTRFQAARVRQLCSAYPDLIEPILTLVSPDIAAGYIIAVHDLSAENPDGVLTEQVIEHVGGHAKTVTTHLRRAQDAGLVVCEPETGRAGRPRLRWKPAG